MKVDYEKKDISKSPEVKEVKKDYDGEIYCKRGEWFAINLAGLKNKFATKDEAIEWLMN
jgi:hypothetical protein